MTKSLMTNDSNPSTQEFKQASFDILLSMAEDIANIPALKAHAEALELHHVIAALEVLKSIYIETLAIALSDSHEALHDAMASLTAAVAVIAQYIEAI